VISNARPGYAKRDRRPGIKGQNPQPFAARRGPDGRLGGSCGLTDIMTARVEGIGSAQIEPLANYHSTGWSSILFDPRPYSTFYRTGVRSPSRSRDAGATTTYPAF